MHSVLCADAGLAAHIARRPGLRLPGAWDGLEATIAELLAEADDPGEAMVRIVGTYGQVHSGAPPGLGFVFPAPERLAVAQLEDIGIDVGTAQRVRSLAVAVRDGQLRFSVGQDREALVAQLSGLVRLGPERAQWIALRVLGDPDACPPPPQFLPAAARWRPWRAYAWLHLGAATSDSPLPETAVLASP